jgi:hypothetical protein
MAQDPHDVTIPPAEETERLRSQIEETRAEMSETLEAIHERLRPGRLISDASETVKGAAASGVSDLAVRASDTASAVGSWLSEARYAVIEAVRRNPVPSALVSLGAVLVLLQGIRHRARV